MRVSLTGAVTSKKVTEVYFKVNFKLFTTLLSVIVIYVCLTVRFTNQSGTKVGYSDPIIFCKKFIAQRIKGTPGITG